LKGIPVAKSNKICSGCGAYGNFKIVKLVRYKCIKCGNTKTDFMFLALILLFVAGACKAAWETLIDS